ncbi:hypothetical protein J7T55_008065 [Diaporthe amygdali]|uniref:uncharacterized protein n=1 Tax=Phomopsis amygdali TaxID=1214568 RepID=UPI0022FDFD52|nr:uncharacterized protein J7T55_008065 [Diaporthe amygdali]KAJ0114227.1 hypothetical protein J7T55_008065 [Diaporthe amygdali]
MSPTICTSTRSVDPVSVLIERGTHYSMMASLVFDSDDWSGVSDGCKRRKLQNRLNQRTHQTMSQPGVCIQIGDLKKLIDTISILEVRSKYNEAVLRAFEAYARYSYMNAQPRLEFLPILTQLNLTRALFANVEAMGLSQSQMHDDALSPFNTAGPLTALMSSRQVSLPQTLRPTSLQVAIPHHPWIDLIPIPPFRDNILKALTMAGRPWRATTVSTPAERVNMMSATRENLRAVPGVDHTAVLPGPDSNWHLVNSLSWWSLSACLRRLPTHFVFLSEHAVNPVKTG